MFTKLRIKNFKAWGEQLWDGGIELAPVTLVLGANSAGKTSLLQVPLLLQQTFDSPDRTLDLNLGGQKADLLDLGSYADVIHAHDPSQELGFGLTVHDTTKKRAVDFEYRVTYALAAGAPVVRSLVYQQDGERYGAQRQGKGGYLLEAPGYTPRMMGKRQDARRIYQPERSLTLPAEAIAELGAAGAEMQDLSLAMNQAVSNVAYLGPLRESPERSYLWGRQTPGSLGPRGQRAVYALLASANSRKKRKRGEEGGKGWLVEKVSHWLVKMGIADRVELERQGRSRNFEVILTTRGQRANIVDVGFGISQVLPMLVLAYFVPQGTVIIAEQPEIHLHPRAQVGLAELMVEVARERQVQFIVETHSEHIFRRLQLLIAGAQVGIEDCRLYFVDADRDGQAQLLTLESDRFGRIQNWPPRFFGDATADAERQMKRMLARLREERDGSSRG